MRHIRPDDSLRTVQVDFLISIVLNQLCCLGHRLQIRSSKLNNFAFPRFTEKVVKILGVIYHCIAVDHFRVEGEVG